MTDKLKKKLLLASKGRVIETSEILYLLTDKLIKPYTCQTYDVDENGDVEEIDTVWYVITGKGKTRLKTL